MKICHLTSVHARHDTRIFLKECQSLVRAGYETHLVVADGQADEVRNGVAILDVGAPRNRIDRMHSVVQRVFERALTVDATLFHLHDPELMPVGLKLKRLGKRVIFDAHEDLPKQLLGKPYLNRLSRLTLSMALKAYEGWACRAFDAVIAATPAIHDKFLRINRRTVTINNYPLPGELTAPGAPAERTGRVCYIGGISAIRGVREIVRALELTRAEVRLDLAGPFPAQELRKELQASAGWRRVDELGVVDRLQMREVLARAMAGLVIFHPLPNHVDAQPNKLFEYMSAGVPVIASDFPLWREIVYDNHCGLCVDPLNPRAIAEAIERLVADSPLVQAMGENGRRMVGERYNWESEERKLVSLYAELIGR
ncbi:MAG: glycosyltransferase [Dokdonella sp.]|nr:MAG: glycosyltransferase [Dokdonella sp.]